MPFHPLPLFYGRNTKNLTFPSSAPPVPRSSPPALTLQSFRSCYVLFSFRLSRNILTKRTVRRRRSSVTSSYNWNLRTTGTDRYWLFGRDKSYFFPSTDPNLYFPFVSFPLFPPSSTPPPTVLFPLFSFSSPRLRITRRNEHAPYVKVTRKKGISQRERLVFSLYVVSENFQRRWKPREI